MPISFFFDPDEEDNVSFVFYFLEIRHAQEVEKEATAHKFPKFATNQQNH